MNTETSNKYSSYLAGAWHQGAGSSYDAWNPTANQAIGTVYSCTLGDVNVALTRADEAFKELQHKTGEQIADFLTCLANEIEQLGDELIHTAMAETALPELRLQGERARTCNQIRAFAHEAAEGSWVNASIDTALPDRTPLPKPDIRAMMKPIGPVVVFGASNFPFAFGTLGGDTASALASGNPVVVKGHPSHPATCTLFAKAIDKAIAKCHFPEGTFSLLHSHLNEVGGALVEHPLCQAVGFTGSTGGGRALMDIAASRAKPIPVFAEMGSINPVFILPDAVAIKATDIAKGLSASINMGVGQFCTSPGLIVTVGNEFAKLLAEEMAALPTNCMLNPNIAQAVCNEVDKRAQNSALEVIAGGANNDDVMRPHNTLIKTSAEHFLASTELQEEIFGPVSLLVECESIEQLLLVSANLDGNLTATIHTNDFDNEHVKQLTTNVTNVAGRVLFNGYPTGVEVCPSMQHGGNYPASSAPATTSVGAPAMNRFLRRVAFQDCPQALLPKALQDHNPLNIWRLVDNRMSKNAVAK